MNISNNRKIKELKKKNYHSKVACCVKDDSMVSTKSFLSLDY